MYDDTTLTTLVKGEGTVREKAAMFDADNLNRDMQNVASASREEGFREGFNDFERRLVESNQFNQVQPESFQEPDLLDYAEQPVAMQTAFQNVQSPEQSGIDELNQLLNTQQS